MRRIILFFFGTRLRVWLTAGALCSGLAIMAGLFMASLGSTKVTAFTQGAEYATLAPAPTSAPQPSAAAEPTASPVAPSNPVDGGQNSLANQLKRLGLDDVQEPNVGGVAAMTVGGAAPVDSPILTPPSYRVKLDLGKSLRLRRGPGLGFIAFEGAQPGELLTPTGLTETADGILWIQVTRILTGATGYSAAEGLE